MSNILNSDYKFDFFKKMTTRQFVLYNVIMQLTKEGYNTSTKTPNMYNLTSQYNNIILSIQEGHATSAVTKMLSENKETTNVLAGTSGKLFIQSDGASSEHIDALYQMRGDHQEIDYEISKHKELLLKTYIDQSTDDKLKYSELSPTEITELEDVIYRLYTNHKLPQPLIDQVKNQIYMEVPDVLKQSTQAHTNIDDKISKMFIKFFGISLQYRTKSPLFIKAVQDETSFNVTDKNDVIETINMYLIQKLKTYTLARIDIQEQVNVESLENVIKTVLVVLDYMKTPNIVINDELISKILTNLFPACYTRITTVESPVPSFVTDALKQHDIFKSVSTGVFWDLMKRINVVEDVYANKSKVPNNSCNDNCINQAILRTGSVLRHIAGKTPNHLLSDLKQHGAVIYTGKGCIWCDKLTKLLRSNNITFKTIDITDSVPPGDLLYQQTSDYKTIPKVFINNVFVGGYKEVEILFNKQSDGPIKQLYDLTEQEVVTIVRIITGKKSVDVYASPSAEIPSFIKSNSSEQHIYNYSIL